MWGKKNLSWNTDRLQIIAYTSTIKSNPESISNTPTNSPSGSRKGRSWLHEFLACYTKRTPLTSYDKDAPKWKISSIMYLKSFNSESPNIGYACPTQPSKFQYLDPYLTVLNWFYQKQKKPISPFHQLPFTSSTPIGFLILYFLLNYGFWGFRLPLSEPRISRK